MKLSKAYLNKIIKEEIIREQNRIISENILKNLYRKLISLKKQKGEGSSFQEVNIATDNWIKERNAAKTVAERQDVFAKNIGPIVEKIKEELKQAQKLAYETPIIDIDDSHAMSLIKAIIKPKYGDVTLQKLEKDMSLYDVGMQKAGDTPLF